MLEKSGSFTKLKDFIKKYQNEVLATFMLLFVMIFVSVRYDLYLDLNDDVLIKEILSGAYTGVPRGHNIQMLYPLSLAISLIYRLLPFLPVYGIFLAGCQFGCFWLLSRRCIQFRSSLISKLFIGVFSTLIMLGLFLEHFVFVQYTMTSALLGATAAFLFLTSTAKPGESLFKKNGICIILCGISFMLRSEMLLLLFPMIGAAGLIRWSWEKEVFAADTVKRYLSFAAGVILTIFLAYAVNAIAYGSKDWSEFMDYFNSRTELYDYEKLPEYEGNEKLYTSLGMTKAERKMLIEDYNFGMEEKVDSKTLQALADEAKKIKNKTGSVRDSLVRSIKEYTYRMSNKTADDYPWNLLVIMGYLAVLIGGIWHGSVKKQQINSVFAIGWKLLLLGTIRSGLWLFILYRNRSPVRITHGLYMMEFWILLAMLVMICMGIDARLYGSLKATLVFPLMLGIVLAAALPGAVAATDQNFVKREEINRTDQLFREYCKENETDFFWLDVYSSVDYSYKLLIEPNQGIQNFDIMGGWACKSPLFYEKQAAFLLGAMEEELVNNPKVFLAADLERGTDWLTDYYADRGREVEPELVEVLNSRLGIYRLNAVADR